MAPIPRFTFPVIYSIWFNHVRVSSTINPKDLTNFTLLVLQLSVVTIIYGVLPGSLSNLLILFGVPMITNTVLSVLRFSLLILSHLQILQELDALEFHLHS